MRLLAIAFKTLRIIFWVVLGVALIAFGLIRVLYSQWGQDRLRTQLLDKLNQTAGLEVQLEQFKLSFPLNLNLSGLRLVQNGDTLIQAEHAKVDVALLPLMKGEVRVREALLAGARYQMGNADSAMILLLKADTILLRPASVKLASMDITLDEGRLAHALVSLTSKPDTIAKPAAKADSASSLRINVKHLNIEDLTYQMSMLPTIDSLGTNVGRGQLSGAVIDLKEQTVKIRDFSGSRLNAAYIAPDSLQIAMTPVAPPTDEYTKPWTVEIDSIHFVDSQGLYTTHGLEPLPGLDFAYIQADSMEIAVSHFYNQATNLRLPITLKGIERCGVRLDASGTFSMDSTTMYFTDFSINTPYSSLFADGLMGVGDMTLDPKLPLQLQASGQLGVADLNLMFPAFKPYLAGLAPSMPLKLGIDLDGTAGRLNLKDVSLKINRCASLHAYGTVSDLFHQRGPNANVSLQGSIVDFKSIAKAIFEPGSGIAIPPMTIDGKINMLWGDMKGNLDVKTLGGTLALNAAFNSNDEGYNLTLNTAQFPVNAFMPDLGVGKATLQMTAKGQGLDLFKETTDMDVSMQVNSLEYGGYDYQGILLSAAIHGGMGRISSSCQSKDLKYKLTASGNLDGDTYDWTARLDDAEVDLQALKFSPTAAFVTLSMDAQASATPSDNEISATLMLRDLNYSEDVAEYVVSNVRANFSTTDSLTNLSITNKDFIANADIHCGLDTIIERMDTFAVVLDRQIAQKKVYADTLQQILPKFAIYASAGNDNFINDILYQQKMRIKRLSLDAANDSTLHMSSQILGFRTSDMRLDTISVNLMQEDNRMHLVANVDNRPGTLDDWAHVRFDAILNTGKLALRASQRNIKGVTGYDIGSMVALGDSTVSMSIFPLNPTIGYKPWTVNFDNYIKYCFPTRQIDANLHMTGEKSSLALYTTAPTDSVDIAKGINEINLKVGNINLADWISINPFAPPIEGKISADMRIDWDGQQTIDGKGNLSFVDFYYDRQRVGSFVSNLNVSTNTAGMIKAKADLLIDGNEAVTISGVLNDSTQTTPFDLDLALIKFPLSIANPFLPQDVAHLNGTLNGTMCVTGDADNTKINGEIYFDQAAIKLDMLNTSYAFSDVKIPVVDNVVSFNDFGIYGTNENPLLINGNVNLKKLIDPTYDLKMTADNTMIVNSNRAAKNAEIYGKAYINLNAGVKGNLRMMRVNANLTVLSGTNVTYVMTAASSTMQAPSESGMVKFVNFNDTEEVLASDSISTDEMMMVLDATLAIQNGTTVNVDLSGNARDKVQIQPQGTLNYTMSPLNADGRMTGRIVLNSGFARYVLPVVGAEKMFTVDQGSYIAFNGDILNPTLNLHATDVVKTNVTVEGQNSRLVNFDILLGVTGTLSVMNVKFDLSTNDDITIANELQSMSAEQRANQAMNLLLYNVYTGPGTKGNGNLTANPLYSFLESQVNNWAANNIKGVDLTFGIDQYNQTTNGSTASTMSYSYQVSKTLFNDRFKIVVGGNYTTDDNPDENLSENLISDISFEYYLNKQQTMLVKLFRHTGYESILEGEVTQTGVGFVYKRKLNRLVQILPKRLRPRKYKRIEQ